jgi:hypothetical protein
VLTAVDTLGYCSKKHPNRERYLFLMGKKGMVSRMSGTAFRVHFRVLCIYITYKENVI